MADLQPIIIKKVYKSGGGHGGHNGVRDIAKALGTSDFHRLRIGIGRPKGDGIDYVLGEPSKQDAQAIQNNIDDAIALMPLLVDGKIQDAMKKLHTNPEKVVGQKSEAISADKEEKNNGD